MYKVISSGSKGNCVIYGGIVAVDIGIPYAKLKPYIKGLQVVLLTHEHHDHINIAALERLCFERPGIRVASGAHMRPYLTKIRNVDYMEVGTMYDYSHFKVSPVALYHDVPNYGWRIQIKQPDGSYYRILHATDTAHLDGITADYYDLYAIEHNYNEDTVYDTIAQLQANGAYAYQVGAINSHLSEQQARDFIFKNMGENSQILRLHEPSNQINN